MAKTPKKPTRKPKTMRSAKAVKPKPRWAILTPVGEGEPIPAPVEIPDPTNAADGCILYVKAGKFVLSSAPLPNDDSHPYWDKTAKIIKWSAV